MKTFLELLPKSFVIGIVPFAMLIACSDYEGMIDDEYDEWIAEQNSSANQSSSSANVLTPDTPKSSASIPASSAQVTLSSSSVTPTTPSSSSLGSTPGSSAGEKPEVSKLNLGYCYATVNGVNEVTSIQKGASVIWAVKLNPNNTSGVTATDFVNGSFSWDFGTAGMPATSTGRTSSAITYATSGTAGASVTASFKGGLVSETITCAPLQVNGDPITGCTCATEASSVDYTSNPDVTWTVTGCTSQSMLVSYLWDGIAGSGASYTKTFTTAAAGYAPTLKVANEDNTVVDVTCPAVRVNEGPEYIIADGQSKVELPAAGKYNVVIGYACHSDFYCNGNDGPVGGSVNGTPMESSWYTTARLTAADCTGSATVVVEVTGPATCGAL